MTAKPRQGKPAQAGEDRTPTRRSRGSLSEEEIVLGALALAKRDGLDGLSMPNLARHLGAGVMSLYWYFHSKEELLGAMAEHTVKEVYARLPLVGNGAWDDEVIRLMTAFREELRRTPLFAQLCSARPRFLMSRPGVMPILARRIDEQLQVLQRLGLDAADAMRVHNILSAYTLGFLLMQQGLETKGDEPTVEQALKESVTHLDPAEFPTLLAVRDLGALVSVKDEDHDDFLRLLVAGMKSEFGPA